MKITSWFPVSCKISFLPTQELAVQQLVLGTVPRNKHLCSCSCSSKNEIEHELYLIIIDYNFLNIDFPPKKNLPLRNNKLWLYCTLEKLMGHMLLVFPIPCTLRSRGKRKQKPLSIHTLYFLFNTVITSIFLLFLLL